MNATEHGSIVHGTHRPIWRGGLGLLGWLVLCFAAAGFGAQFMSGLWYEQLDKPTWTPPNAVFGPVWTVLYFLMALAAWLVWLPGPESRATRIALGLFLVQLVLNALWSWLFFGLQRPALAAGELLLLWVALLATVVMFWRVRPVAGALLLPYLAWSGFALALNVAIARLN